MATDLAFTPAIEQAQLIRRREISPLELVELYLTRIQQLDSQLNSYVTVMAEPALAQAKLQTEQLGQDASVALSSPLWGVPISVKDLNAVAGIPCSYGVQALKQKVPDYDDGVVTRLKQAGLIILGKTATSELGSLPYTEPDGFPPTRNPWHLDYTPGGSSGGAAAGLAAGLSAIAQGSDGGGSIRGPAFCCGLVGIKPARGRVSYAPIGEAQNGIATNGPLARTVPDAAALLDVMSGYITGDPYWLPDPSPSFLECTQLPLSPLKIAFATDIPPVGPAHPACGAGVLQTVQQLTDMGHQLEMACPNFADLVEPFTCVWSAGIAATGIPGPALGKMNQWFLGQTPSVGQYLRAVSRIQVLARQIVGFFQNFDVLVLPTYLQPPIPIGAYADLTPDATLEKIAQWIFPCPPFNATGQPAIAIPTGFAQNGLPVGVQLVGRPGDEATLITLAAHLERAKPWGDQRPNFG